MTEDTPFWRAMFVAAALTFIVVLVSVLQGLGFPVPDARVELIIGIIVAAGGMGAIAVARRSKTPPADDGESPGG